MGDHRMREKGLPVNRSGLENRFALQEMLDRGGTVRVEEPGIYEIEGTLYIQSHTCLIFGKGVMMKRSVSSEESFFLVNRGALSRTWDSDITIEGLHLITNGVEARNQAQVYGLTGEISFFYVKRLRVYDFMCMGILAGSWVDWYQGMEIQNSDTVVSNGKVYRAFQKPDGEVYRSVTPPSQEEGMCVLDGINWVMVQKETVYSCGCQNLHFKDIHLQKARSVALSVHFDHDRYSRSVYPGAKMPVQENIILENMVIQNETACMVRSITPVDTIKIINSVIGTKKSGTCQVVAVGNLTIKL